MGAVHVFAHIGLDGHIDGVGGPDSPHIDEGSGALLRNDLAGADALLLGRRTYDLWRGYWPQQTDEIAEVFNRVPKYVASRGTPELDWAESIQLRDPATEVAALTDRHEQIHIWGSSELVHTLLAEGLVDELHLWLYPTTSAEGPRLFGDGAPWTFEWAEPARTFARGVTLLHLRNVGPTPEADIGPGAASTAD